MEWHGRMGFERALLLVLPLQIFTEGIDGGVL